MDSQLPLDVYVRVSRVNGRRGDSFLSPQLQEEKCRALAQARGYDVGEVIEDLDQSGGTMDRPGLNVALDRIRDGASGGILVARIDRFARTLPGALRVLEEIERAGGVLIEVDGDWDTSTPMGRFARDLVLRIAQLYREQVSEAWDDAKRKAVERGIHPTQVPVGYVRQNRKGLQPDPKTADHVRKLFSLRAQGASWRDLCDHAERVGLKPHRASRWTITSMSQVLHNRVYLGEARMGKHVNPDAHEPLVTRAQWNAAQVKHPSRTVRGTEGVRLAGLVFCASCGGRLTPELPSHEHAKTRQTRRFGEVKVLGPGRYTCRSRNAEANIGCEARASARMDDLDALVVDAFVARYRDRVGQMDDEPEPPETGDLRRMLRHAEDALQALVDDPLSIGMLSSKKRKELLENAQAEVDDARAKLDAVEVSHETSVVNVWGLGDLFEPDAIHELPVPEQRRLLTAGIERVKVARGGRRELDDRVTIVWRD